MTENQVSKCACCGREARQGDLHCIFHSMAINVKKDEFDKEFWVEFERQRKYDTKYDFTDFVFPGKISFKGEVFEKDAFFKNAVFHGHAEFWGAEFLGEANFDRAKFNNWADFSSTQFKMITVFRYVDFIWDAIFQEAKFYGVTFFFSAVFHADAKFIDTLFFNSADFVNAKFSQLADFEKTWFSSLAKFESINFDDHKQLNLIDTYFHDVSGLFEYIENNRKKFIYPDKTEFLPMGVRPSLGEKAADHYPIINRKIQDDKYLIAFKKRHPRIHFFWWFLADCGRSLGR